MVGTIQQGEGPPQAVEVLETAPCTCVAPSDSFRRPKEGVAAERFRSSYLLLVRRPATADVVALASDEARIVGG